MFPMEPPPTTLSASAPQLRRQLGIARYETAWMMLHKLRRAMVGREREPLKHEVEVDEFFMGGHAQGLRGGRQRGAKALVVAAVAVRGEGSGRLRLQSSPTPLLLRSAASSRRRSLRARSSIPTAGPATPTSPRAATSTARAASGRTPTSTSCRASTGRSPTSRAGWAAPTAASPLTTCRSTSTSTSSVSTAAAHRWPLSRPARPRRHQPTTYRQIIARPERTG